MKNYILTTTLACMAISLTAQEFVFRSTFPFGLQFVRSDGTCRALRIMFQDMDSDGDYDAIITGIETINISSSPMTWADITYFIDVQENIGDRYHPVFDERKVIYDHFPFPAGYFFVAAGDVNGDGRTDFLVNGNVDEIGNRSLIYCRQNEEGATESFTAFSSADLDLPDFVPASHYVPLLVDLDGDGDLDILMSGNNPPFSHEETDIYPQFYYAVNTGTPAEPNFVGWFTNPYGLVSDPLVVFATGAGDIDLDGDTDLIGTTNLIGPDSLNSFYVYINTPGQNGKPAFGPPVLSPFGLPVGQGEIQFRFPELVDIDGDGDPDLFVNRFLSSSTVIEYYENRICAVPPVQIAVDLCEGESYTYGDLTFTEAGEYEFHIQEPGGCDTLVSVTITQVPHPVGSLAAEICFGESLVLGQDTFDTSGEYMVFVPSPDGCDSLIMLSLVVHEEINGDVSADEHTLTAMETGVSYQWIDCSTQAIIAGAQSQSYTATASGEYAVIITDAFGCSVVSECYAVVIVSTGNPGFGQEMKIYPNPATGHFLIEPPRAAGEGAIRLLDLQGREVFTMQYRGEAYLRVPFDGADGVYLVELVGGNGMRYINRIIINH